MQIRSAGGYDITPLIEAMQDPGAYPHPVEAIHVIQTHTACVFLTGEYAYKIKKPVYFGFLDYRMLEQRRAFCEQEMILNRRLCPDIYLDVVPLTNQQGRLQIGGEGSAVEWAVRMRQLREADMLPARLQTNTLEENSIERLAHTLAGFHNRAHTDETVRAYGSTVSLADTIAVTLRTMQQVIADTPRTEIFHTLHSYFARFQEQQTHLFRERVHQNRIRDCHGDLRAQNICLDARFSEGIQIFDCIEFNPSFRYIDTAADIAYLAMDLDLAGHSALRARLLEIYAREANDNDLAQILPFYLTYRAMVRGNIALLAAQESEVPAAERQAQHDLAGTAYDLAWSYAGRRARPALLITVGYSGSGKSVLTREVCRRLPAIPLSSDRLRKERAGTEAAAHLETSHYAPERRSAIYDMLRQEAGAWLSRHEHVVLDATFLDPYQRQAAVTLAQEHNAEFWVLDCQCPDAVIRQRLAARSEDPNASDACLNVYLQQRRASETTLPCDQEAVSQGGYILADMTRPVSDIAHTVVSRFLTI